MAGFRNDDESRPPEVPEAEAFIVDDDGVARPGRQPSPRPRRSAMGAGRRIGILLAAVALVAVGVVLGRGTRTVTPGTASAAPTTSSRPPTSTAPASSTASSGRAGSADPAPPTGSSTESSPGSSTSSSVDETSHAASADSGDGGPSAPWPSTRGICGQPVPKPFIEGATAPPSSVGLRLIAGGSPTPVDLAHGTVGTALVTPPDAHYVAGIAANGENTVLLIAPCRSGDHRQVIRVTPDGKQVDVDLPGDAIQLVSGGDRIWVAVSTGGALGYSPMPLVAADGTGTTVMFPKGLVPVAARGTTIVGQYLSGGAPTGRFAIVDSATGSVVKRFGHERTDDQGNVVMVNAVADGDYVITAPWSCDDQAPCRIHRYNIVTGLEHTARLRPHADRILAGGLAAISPNGATAAITLPDQPPSPAPFDPDPPPSTGPSGTVRIGLLDLGDGHLRALPGVTLGPTEYPALAFSPDGAWLVVAVPDGDSTRIVLYRADGHGPYDPRVAVPGPVMWPALVVAPSSSS